MFISTPGELTDPSHLSRNTELHSRINVSRLLVSARKFWHCASLTADTQTQITTLGVLKTPWHKLAVALMVAHMPSIMRKCVLTVLGDRWADLPTETLEGLSGTGSIQTWSRRLQITPARNLGSSLCFSPRKPQGWAKAIIEKNLDDTLLSRWNPVTICSEILSASKKMVNDKKELSNLKCKHWRYTVEW